MSQNMIETEAAVQAAMKRQAEKSAVFLRQDRIFAGITFSFAALVLLVLFGILVSLIVQAWPAINEFGLGFFYSTTWSPSTGEFGAGIAIWGTLATSLIALLIGVPISFGIAMFLTESCPVWMRRPLGTAIELLAGVPSIIYGFWGLFIFAPIVQEYIQPWMIHWFGEPFFAGPPLGLGVFTAGLVLALMVIPFIASVMRDVFETVPGVLKESAYGIGCTRWEVVKNIVLPYTRVGVIGGVMLGLGRALGETMAVTFVIGNANRFSLNLFAPGNSIASTLANEFAEASEGLHQASLIYLGLVLFFITFVVLSLSKVLLARMQRSEGTKS